MPIHCAARLMVSVGVVLLCMAGCGKPKTPPRVYTAAATGAGSVELLVNDFKKAYAARDTDAAMRLFYWSSADDQAFWLRLFNEMFSIDYKEMDITSPPDENDPKHKVPKTDLPIVAQLRVTRTSPTVRTEQKLLIGRNDQGFYFIPPINN